MKNALCPATTLLGSATLPFVISTEAKRSGEISVLTTSLGNVFRESVPGFPATQHWTKPRVRAFLFKERRMRSANATKIYRKSGVAKSWFDVRVKTLTYLPVEVSVVWP
jgi:hypothetical protein